MISHFMDMKTEAYRGPLPTIILAIQWLHQISSPCLFQLKLPLLPQCFHKQKSSGDLEKRKLSLSWKNQGRLPIVDGI